MVTHNVFDAEVDIEIPKDIFPTREELEEMERNMPGSQHGWMESTYQNKKLHYRYYLPKGDVKGVAVHLHGIGGNVSNGLIVDDRKLGPTLLSDELNKQGIALYCLDQYGHGFSEGVRFLIPESYEINKQDSINFCKLTNFF